MTHSVYTEQKSWKRLIIKSKSLKCLVTEVRVFLSNPPFFWKGGNATTIGMSNAGVDFTNFLWAAFTRNNPKSRKQHWRNWLSFCTLGIFVCKSCLLNVDEIEPRCLGFSVRFKHCVSTMREKTNFEVLSLSRAPIIFQLVIIKSFF